MGTRPSSTARAVAVTIAGAVAVAGAYAVGTGTGSTPTAVAAEGDSSTTTRTIVMTGTGEATGVPDELTFRLSVNKKAADVGTALAQANATMRRVLAALADAEVARRDVQTTGLSVRPDYDYSSSGPPILTGYVVTESASVVVRDLASSGIALTAAVRAGGNAVRVSGVGLRIGDREALLAKARDAAVAAAKAKADQYAAATGQTLGAVISVKEGHATPARSYRDRASYDVAGSAAAKVPIRAGSEDLEVTVSIVWQFAG